VFINTEHVEGFLGDLPRDAAAGSNLREIAGTAQEPVGYARCAPAASSNFFGARVVHLNVQNFGGAMKDDEQIRGFVEIEPVNDAEARPKRCGDKSSAGRGTGKGEMIQVERVDARARSLADHQIDPKVFHRGIEDLFNRRLQAMDLIKEKDFALFEGSQDSC
jgi:hypothetical protein